MLLTNEFLYSEKSQQALSVVCNRKFDSKTAYSLMKIRSACEKQAAKFFPRFMDLVVKYAYLNEDGSLRRDHGDHSFTIKPEHADAWNKESKALLEESFEVTKTSPISIDVLSPIEPEVLQALLPLVEEPETLEQ